jgi:hypothetical protein
MMRPGAAKERKRCLRMNEQTFIDEEAMSYMAELET